MTIKRGNASDVVTSFLIILLGLSLALSISATEIVTAVLLIQWFWKAKTSPDSYRSSSSPLDFPLIVYYLWGVCSAFVNHSTGTLDAFARYDSLLLFFLIGRGITMENRHKIFSWFILGCVFAGFLGAIQFCSKINFRSNTEFYSIPSFYSQWPSGIVHYLSAWNDRSVGTRNHPLTYAEGLMPAFLLLFAGLFVLNPKKNNFRQFFIFCLSGSILIGLGLSFSQTRGVLVGIVGGLLLLLFIWRRKIPLMTLSAVVVLFGLIFLTLPSSINGRMLSIISRSQGSAGDQQSKSTRMNLWRQSWQSIKSHPVIGVGLEGAHFVVLDPLTGQPTEWSESHNIYLQTAVETGWIGLGILIWVIFSTSKLIWKSNIELKGPFAAILISFLLAGLTESWLGDKEIAMIFWVFVGWMDAHRKENDGLILSIWPFGKKAIG